MKTVTVEYVIEMQGWAYLAELVPSAMLRNKANKIRQNL
jgi:hypothetical protein